MSDLHEVIEDSISDAELPVETATDDVSEAPVETTTDDVVAETPEAPVEEAPVTDEVASPAAQTQKDDFEKKFGIPGTSSSGRENRIPYSRVKKISEKAAADAVAAKVKEFEPKLAEYETKVKDYEGRLTQVAEFENVMVTDADAFAGMLRQLPNWKPFFDKYDAAVAGQTQQPQAEVPAAAAVPDEMPAPDQELSDGTKVYSMDGLKALNAWNRAQAKKEALAEFAPKLAELEKRYEPIEKSWQSHQKVQEIIPQVQQQIAEARTWPLFNEHENEIVVALQKDQRLSLEGAYRQVVYPKLVADRTKMREEILREVKQAPKATAATTSASRSSAQTTPTGPRNLEDVIGDAIKGLK